MKPKSTISESFFLKLAKMLISPKYRPALEKYEKDLKNDPEFKVLLDDMSKKQEELDAMVKNHCKRWPDSPLCNNTK
jgi:transcription termination factor NusB